MTNTHTIKVLFKANRNGKNINFKKDIDCDIDLQNDETIPEMLVNNGTFLLPKTVISKWQKADTWISEQSELLRDLINSKELNYIIDWKVLAIDKVYQVPIKRIDGSIQLHEIELDKMANILKQMNNDNEFSESFKRGFLYCYLKLKTSLHNIPITQKIEIIISSMGLGVDAANAAYKNVLDILNLDK